jgi:hypothetical protein
MHFEGQITVFGGETKDKDEHPSNVLSSGSPSKVEDNEINTTVAKLILLEKDF